VPAVNRNHPLLAAARGVAVFMLAASFSASPQNTVPPPSPATPTQAPVYDVMIIRPNNGATEGSDTNADDGHFSAHNVSLKQLLKTAFDIKQDLISGIPSPIESARFDIEAKVVDPDLAVIKKLTREQNHHMLLPLLTDRFQLKTHIEVKTLPVYELVVAKGGAKLKLSTDQTPNGGDINTNGGRTQIKITAWRAPLDSVAKALSNSLDRPVINKTGIAGNFDLNLLWSKDDSSDPNPDAPPTIFTAIQEQLGLKLEPAKGPVETLVVDHAEMPSEN
jgi:uncharacterized protein (TIGR03435 family)